MTHARPDDEHPDLDFRMSHDRPLLGDDDEVLLALAFVLRPDPGGASGGVDVYIEHADTQPPFLPWEALELLFTSATLEAVHHLYATWKAKAAQN